MPILRCDLRSDDVILVLRCSDSGARGKLRPNVAAEWLELLLGVREVPGSDLGPQAGCPAERVFVFFSVSS